MSHVFQDAHIYGMQKHTSYVCVLRCSYMFIKTHAGYFGLFKALTYCLKTHTLHLDVFRFCYTTLNTFKQTYKRSTTCIISYSISVCCWCGRAAHTRLSSLADLFAGRAGFLFVSRRIWWCLRNFKDMFRHSWQFEQL